MSSPTETARPAPRPSGVGSIRFTLRQGLLGIAVVAVFLATLRVAPQVAAGLAWAVPITLMAWFIARGAGPSRITCLLGFSATYPLLCTLVIHAAWVSAWILLGHRPRVSRDDPTDVLGSFVVALSIWPLVGLLPAGLWTLGLAAAVAIRSLLEGQGVRSALVPGLVRLTLPLLVFAVGYWSLGIGPALEWLWD